MFNKAIEEETIEVIGAFEEEGKLWDSENGTRENRTEMEGIRKNMISQDLT